MRNKFVLEEVLGVVVRLVELHNHRGRGQIIDRGVVPHVVTPYRWVPWKLKIEKSDKNLLCHDRYRKSF
jgi:hypothetical protein